MTFVRSIKRSQGTLRAKGMQSWELHPFFQNYVSSKCLSLRVLSGIHFIAPTPANVLRGCLVSASLIRLPYQRSDCLEERLARSFLHLHCYIAIVTTTGSAICSSLTYVNFFHRGRNKSRVSATFTCFMYNIFLEDDFGDLIFTSGVLCRQLILNKMMTASHSIVCQSSTKSICVTGSWSS